MIPVIIEALVAVGIIGYAIYKAGVAIEDKTWEIRILIEDGMYEIESVIEDGIHIIRAVIEGIYEVVISIVAEIHEEEEIIAANEIATIDTITGKEFENFISLCFRKIGYLTELTSDSQDYGADIILYKNNIKTVVQTKRWKNKVGVKAVQETIGARQYYKAEKGIVITNNYFTKNATNLAEATDIELWNRDRVINLILRRVQL